MEYTSGEEWQKFIIEVATVGANRYEATVFTDNSLDIEDLLEKANEEAIVGTHERNKIFGESKLAFEKALQFPFDHFLLTESKRYTKAKRQLTNQQAGSLRAWRRVQRFLYSARGPWGLSSAEHQDELKHWKLSNVENFSRMRLKLCNNYNFDSHLEASQARDNRNVTNDELKKTLPDIDVKPMLEDENDGDEDWNALVPNPALV